jgi:hypothetical protein
MLHNSVAVMKEKLLQVQQLIKRLRRMKEREKKNRTWLRLFGLLIHSYSSASCLLKMLMEISIMKAPLHQTPQRVPATIRMTLGQAANLAIRLNLWRYHQVISLTDLDKSNTQLELCSHRTGR